MVFHHPVGCRSCKTLLTCSKRENGSGSGLTNESKQQAIYFKGPQQPTRCCYNDCCHDNCNTNCYATRCRRNNCNTTPTATCCKTHWRQDAANNMRRLPRRETLQCGAWRLHALHHLPSQTTPTNAQAKTTTTPPTCKRSKAPSAGKQCTCKDNADDDPKYVCQNKAANASAGKLATYIVVLRTTNWLQY